LVKVDARLMFKSLREACVRSHVCILEGPDYEVEVSGHTRRPRVQEEEEDHHDEGGSCAGMMTMAIVVKAVRSLSMSCTG
jgi:hypothetical protein